MNVCVCVCVCVCVHRAVGVGPASLAIAGPVWELIKHAKAVYCCD